MPPPPPLRRSLPISSKPNTSNSMENQSQSVLVKKTLVQSLSNSSLLLSKFGTPSERLSKSPQNTPAHMLQKAGSLVSRRMSLPQGRMPTLTPKPSNISPLVIANSSVNSSRQSLSPRSNVFFVKPNALQQSKPVATGIRPQMSQVNKLPTLSMGTVTPKIIGKLPNNGQNVVVYTSVSGQTPVIRAVSSTNGTNSTNKTTFVMRPPQSLLLPPTSSDVRIVKIANRRCSMAARPSDIVRTSPNITYINGSRTVKAIVADDVIRPNQATNIAKATNVARATNLV